MQLVARKSLLSLLTVLLVLLTINLWGNTAVAAIDVYDFDNAEQEEQFKQLSHTLRCPKCQNNTISDSNAELAKDLRTKVYEMTKAGKSKQEIIDYMVARYGNFVTYNPPLTTATAILWVAPFSVVILGFAVIVYRSKKVKSSGNDSKNEFGSETLITASAEPKADAANTNRLSEQEEARLNSLLNEDGLGTRKPDSRKPDSRKQGDIQ